MAVTASVQDADRARCLEAGMDAFLTKPLKEDALARALSLAPPSEPGPRPATPRERPAETSSGELPAGPFESFPPI